MCEKDENRIKFVNEHYPAVLTVTPDKCLDFVRENSDHGGADVVLGAVFRDKLGTYLADAKYYLTLD